jgi:hypothetical protein
MTSYYKTISGVKYDKDMLEEADKSVAGKRDGRISMNDAKKIKKKALDGPGITEVELRTLNYIFDNYNFTPSAKDYFSTFLPVETPETTNVVSDTKASKGSKDTGSVEISPEEEAVETIEETVTEVKGFFARYYLLIIVILLVIFFLYLYSDRLYNLFIKDPDTPVTVKIEDVQETDSEKDEVKVQQVPVAPITPVVPVAGENEYIIKEKDTLFDISGRLYGDPDKWEELYELNKDIIKEPSMIFPGQKIRTDIK